MSMTHTIGGARTKLLGAVVLLLAGAAPALDIPLTSQRATPVAADDPRDDLRPGLTLTGQVRFDADPVTKNGTMIVWRGRPESEGAFFLRIDPVREGRRFSFFVNLDGSPEPRVTVPLAPQTNTWYAFAAGWDGTNLWLSVNGQKASRSRAGEAKIYPLRAKVTGGRLDGALRDVAVTTPPETLPTDLTVRPGLLLACDATFRAPPRGETAILQRANEYLLRYDVRETGGVFGFWVFADGGWEPRAAVSAATVETGRVYRLVANWNGRDITLAVDGEPGATVKRMGRCAAHPKARLVLGTPGVVDVANLIVRNEPRELVDFAMFRTRELMPVVGKPATVRGALRNFGEALGACTVTASARGDVTIAPATITLPGLAANGETPLEWTVDAGTNGFAYLDFSVTRADAGKSRRICRASKRFVFMPEREPALTAAAWQPPIRPTRTWHVDAMAGDDARDGLTPATAWRTFANVKNLALGPGERLLLRRGSVFTEELQLAAAGAPDNWAEIGAYGTGGRPQIRRTRHFNERCAYIEGAYVAVRDLIVCNAGSGLTVTAPRDPAAPRGHVLVERCLAHHIEGGYRFNAHGIPEWRDAPGPAGQARSTGVAAVGLHHVVMRDCETYQCSSGFRIGGTDTYVNRMFCHDNYAHNTSPHPYNTASRSWITDCVFDASGWHASAGTMGIMLAGNDGWVMRGCHFLNQPDSGSGDEGGIDFETSGENCLVDRCTFRNNAGAAIEVLGLRTPQTRNVHIRGCKFVRDNWAYRNGPCEIQVWGWPSTSGDVTCSNGRIEGNGYVLLPGVPFYVNHTRTTNDWILADNREFAFEEDLDAAFPYPNPPAVTACGEVWTDAPEAALFAKIDDAKAAVSWEAVEGPAGVVFANDRAARTTATFPGEGDWRLNVTADNGTLWRTARTAVHVLPPGARTAHAWDFARNLDPQGWRPEATGTDYEYIHATDPFWNTEAFPVELVCGDAYVIAVKESAEAALVSARDRRLGVTFNAHGANALRIRMQNHTTSRRMRVWWQTSGAPTWDRARSVAFAVVPQDGDDRVYTVPLPPVGGVKQMKLAFSADGEPVTGTVRLDYIWAGWLP